MNNVFLKPVLMTVESMSTNDWNKTEWFGVEFPYVPYWEANDFHDAYGWYRQGFLDINIERMFEYLVVYKNGEFLCSFEIGHLYEAPCHLRLSSLTLIKDSVGIKNAVCSSK